MRLLHLYTLKAMTLGGCIVSFLLFGLQTL
jgi:hypothetical protein